MVRVFLNDCRESVCCNITMIGLETDPLAPAFLCDVANFDIFDCDLNDLDLRGVEVITLTEVLKRIPEPTKDLEFFWGEEITSASLTSNK